jgi:hypothetical protein
MTTRNEHLVWCKERALDYVDKGDLQQAFLSMTSDLGKHSETASSLTFCQTLGTSMFMSGQLNTAFKMRDFIEGFN